MGLVLGVLISRLQRQNVLFTKLQSVILGMFQKPLLYQWVWGASSPKLRDHPSSALMRRTLTAPIYPQQGITVCGRAYVLWRGHLSAKNDPREDIEARGVGGPGVQGWPLLSPLRWFHNFPLQWVCKTGRNCASASCRAFIRMLALQVTLQKVL